MKLAVKLADDVIAALQFHLLPIRDWNLWAIIIWHIFKALQFHLLPIRDWNNQLEFLGSKSEQRELQFHLLPIRDWNLWKLNIPRILPILQFHLLPIRDWNFGSVSYHQNFLQLQFHLLPIRDWNSYTHAFKSAIINCNFTYSLLGIETTEVSVVPLSRCLLQFHLLPIRDWNNSSSAKWRHKRVQIAISLTPY